MIIENILIVDLWETEKKKFIPCESEKKKNFRHGVIWLAIALLIMSGVILAVLFSSF